MDEDGIRDPNELGLPGILIALWCAQNGQHTAKIATETTDSMGLYMFAVRQPGECFIQVETDGYLYGPVVGGGNQLGPDGRSPEVEVHSSVVVDNLLGGLFLPFEEICDGRCSEAIEDCGWGIWNACTCQVTLRASI